METRSWGVDQRRSKVPARHEGLAIVDAAQLKCAQGQVMPYFTQLNPTIPVETPKGRAEAIGVLDYGPEHHLCWVCFLDDGGACWTFENPQIRGCVNVTVGRKNG